MGLKNFNAKQFATDIKTKRLIENNYPIRVISKELKISDMTISKMENQQCLPSLHTYYVICKWLNKDLNYYFKK